MIMDGEVDEYPKQPFNLVGAIEGSEEGKKMMEAAVRNLVLRL